MRRWARGLTVAVASAMLLAGCAGSADVTESVQPERALDAPPAGLERYYGQDFEWSTCPEGVEGASEDDLCGKFRAPKDYANPDAGDLEVMAVRHAEGKNPKRVLFVNPGGPGGSAVNFVAENAGGLLSEEMRQEFAVIGMDSRGTQWSTPVKCLDSAEMDALNEEPSKDGFDPQQLKELQTQAREFGEACLRHGDTAKWMDTASAARDMDILRHLAGAAKLDYLGFSYGTHLGAQYADLFPGHVGSMVLDGPVDPTVSFEELSALQARGFTESVQHYLEWCKQQGECPLKSGQEGLEQLGVYFKGLDTHPQVVGSRKLTGSLAASAVFGGMYSQSWWPQLRRALERSLMHNDGSMLLSISDIMNDRLTDGTYKTNQQEAFWAIHGLDYPINQDPSKWRENAEEIKQITPHLYEYFAWADAQRANWPVKPKKQELKPLHAKGAPKIMVIGTTHDPATPYVMAQGLAKQLDSGVLVTNEGWNHTAYSQAADACIRNTVEDFFLKFVIPRDGTTCG